MLHYLFVRSESFQIERFSSITEVDYLYEKDIIVSPRRSAKP